MKPLEDLIGYHLSSILREHQVTQHKSIKLTHEQVTKHTCINHHTKQYNHIRKGITTGGLRSRPVVYTPSNFISGQEQASTVEDVNAKNAAQINIGAGREDQSQSAPARTENSVKKSETETLR